MPGKGDATRVIPAQFDGGGRGGEIRTHDPLYPKQVRYQTAPRPDRAVLLSSRATAAQAPQSLHRQSAAQDQTARS